METLFKILIYIHAFTGGLGLISGLAGVAVKKGGSRHAKSGKLFSWSMGISSAVSLIIARLPGHENLFLMLIGIFTIYLVLSGNRALTFRGGIKPAADKMDKGISGTMLGLSVIMIVLGGYQYFTHADGRSVLYLFFGGFGVFMTLKDFRTFRTYKLQRNAWLSSHIGRMVAALIASITAFLIAGLHFQTLLTWMLPSILGTGYIAYWNNRIKGRPSPALINR